jgi:ubiquinone/menaquinone biosynthesis C-methylase UbiE/uncharacterized protein YbaR (Trm112 family)
MFKNKILSQIKDIYKQGGNITKFIKETEQNEHNTKESILLSYEYQAGSYVSSYKMNPNMHNKYVIQLVNELKELYMGGTILEAGVGEATTFKYVIQNIGIPHENCYGFDISWSRLKVAKDFLKEDTAGNQNLFAADLSSIPLGDNSVDLVYTSHSIEPNGGCEESILQELYRIAKNYLVLFEPDYEMASDEAKRRMEDHGYIKNLPGVAKKLGCNIVKRELLPYSRNDLNPTSVIVIKKTERANEWRENIFQCPLTKTNLIDCGEIFFAPQAYLMYPVIQGIPCLLDSQAIMGCRYEYPGNSL